MVTTTRHLGDPLALKVGVDEDWGHPLGGPAVPQLTVAIVTPAEHLPICNITAEVHVKKVNNIFCMITISILKQIL